MIRSGTRSASDDALTYLEFAGSLMSIENPNEEWQMLSNITDELGMDHVKFGQVYNGIPIYGSEVIVHGDTKSINSLNGRYYATPESIKTTPSITQDKASEITRTDLGDIKLNILDKFKLFSENHNSSSLVLLPTTEGLKLAYHITIYKNIVSRWEYFIDATNGKVLEKHESICKFHNHSTDHKCSHNSATAVPPVISSSPDLFGTNQNINTFQSGSNFFMIDAVRSEMFDAANSSMPNEPVGTIWTIDAFDTSPEKNDFNYDHVASSNQSFPGKQTAVSAHVNGGKAYEYFINTHNRISINGQGGNIISIINVADSDGGGLDNAFWNGIAMFYGNGRSGFKPLARGLDVAGHEMTHGVIQSTCQSAVCRRIRCSQ